MPGDARREAVTVLNAWSAQEATRELTACCASRRWVAAIADGRPYCGWSELAAASTAGIKALRWSDVLEALDAHPRIGERAAGESREAKWSRAEQSAAASADAAVLGALARVNAEYERRFGHVFLICASGRSAEQILAEARRRLGNDAVAEQQEVRAELAGIALLRLERLERLAPQGEAGSGVAFRCTTGTITGGAPALACEAESDPGGASRRTSGATTAARSAAAATKAAP